MFIQSKSSAKLLQEIKREHSPRIITISEIIKAKQSQIKCGVENDISKETFNNLPDETIKKKKKFKKISGNLMFLNLFSKKTPIPEISDEEIHEDETSPSYYSARSSNSGVFLTARNSVCDSDEEREENISFYSQVPSFTFTPPSTTRTPKSIWGNALQSSKTTVGDDSGGNMGMKNQNNNFLNQNSKTDTETKRSVSEEAASHQHKSLNPHQR
jgi:hypothetical protein